MSLQQELYLVKAMKDLKQQEKLSRLLGSLLSRVIMQLGFSFSLS